MFSVKNPSGAFSSQNQGIHQQFTIDSKAMRKTKITDVEIAVLEATEVGTATLNSFMDTRSLSKIMS